jgi:hypothetical protein
MSSPLVRVIACIAITLGVGFGALIFALGGPLPSALLPPLTPIVLLTLLAKWPMPTANVGAEA